MTTTKSTTQSVKSSRKPQQSKGKNKSPLEALLDAVRFAVGAFSALQDISCKFDEREQSGMKNLKRHAVRHAKMVKDGAKPDAVQLEKTTRLANNVGRELDDRFEAIMNDSFTVFDKGMAEVCKTIPDIRVRDGDKILALQQALRDQLVRSDATYDDTIDAYKAMMAYLPSVSKEAEEVAEAERQRQQRERRVATSDAILAELDALEIE